jgi:hypothetical protein
VTSGVNPIVKWNASTTATLNLYPNYKTTTGQTNGSGVASIIAATNSGYTGTAGCTSAPTQSGTTDDFSSVEKPTGTNTTACDYQDALSVGVTTNSTNWNVTEEMQSGPGTGFTLCGLINGTLYSGTPSAGSPMTGSTITGTSAAINETSCSGSGQLTLATGNSTPTSQTLVATQAVAGTYYIGQDVLLLVTSSTVSIASYSDILTVTLTFN